MPTEASSSPKAGDSAKLKQEPPYKFYSLDHVCNKWPKLLKKSNPSNSLLTSYDFDRLLAGLDPLTWFPEASEDDQPVNHNDQASGSKKRRRKNLPDPQFENDVIRLALFKSSDPSAGASIDELDPSASGDELTTREASENKPTQPDPSPQLVEAVEIYVATDPTDKVKHMVLPSESIQSILKALFPRISQAHSFSSILENLENEISPEATFLAPSRTQPTTDSIKPVLLEEDPVLFLVKSFEEYRKLRRLTRLQSKSAIRKMSPHGLDPSADYEQVRRSWAEGGCSFFSIDTESWERGETTDIIEIGWSIVDRNQPTANHSPENEEQPPRIVNGDDDLSWKQTTEHRLIYEYLGMNNGRYVPDERGSFLFAAERTFTKTKGVSPTPPSVAVDVEDEGTSWEIGAIWENGTKIEGMQEVASEIEMTLLSLRKKGKVFVVFHDYSSDMKVLRHLGIQTKSWNRSLDPSAAVAKSKKLVSEEEVLADVADPDDEDPCYMSPEVEDEHLHPVYVLDTLRLFAALQGKGSGNGTNLRTMTTILTGAPPGAIKGLHNAANDAYYTLLCLSLMASGPPLTEHRQIIMPRVIKIDEAKQARRATVDAGRQARVEARMAASRMAVDIAGNAREPGQALTKEDENLMRKGWNFSPVSEVTRLQDLDIPMLDVEDGLRDNHVDGSSSFMKEGIAEETAGASQGLIEEEDIDFSQTSPQKPAPPPDAEEENERGRMALELKEQSIRITNLEEKVASLTARLEELASLVSEKQAAAAPEAKSTCEPFSSEKDDYKNQSEALIGEDKTETEGEEHGESTVSPQGLGTKATPPWNPEAFFEPAPAAVSVKPSEAEGSSDTLPEIVSSAPPPFCDAIREQEPETQSGWWNFTPSGVELDVDSDDHIHRDHFAVSAWLGPEADHTPSGVELDGDSDDHIHRDHFAISAWQEPATMGKPSGEKKKHFAVSCWQVSKRTEERSMEECESGPKDGPSYLEYDNHQDHLAKVFKTEGSGPLDVENANVPVGFDLVRGVKDLDVEEDESDIKEQITPKWRDLRRKDGFDVKEPKHPPPHVLQGKDRFDEERRQRIAARPKLSLAERKAYMPLIYILKDYERKGIIRARRSQVASTIIKEKVYCFKLVGADRWSEYAAKAEKRGIIVLGKGPRKAGDEWIALKETEDRIAANLAKYGGGSSECSSDSDDESKRGSIDRRRDVDRQSSSFQNKESATDLRLTRESGVGPLYGANKANKQSAKVYKHMTDMDAMEEKEGRKVYEGFKSRTASGFSPRGGWGGDRESDVDFHPAKREEDEVVPKERTAPWAAKGYDGNPRDRRPLFGEDDEGQSEDENDYNGRGYQRSHADSGREFATKPFRKPNVYSEQPPWQKRKDYETEQRSSSSQFSGRGHAHHPDDQSGTASSSIQGPDDLTAEIERARQDFLAKVDAALAKRCSGVAASVAPASSSLSSRAASAFVEDGRSSRFSASERNGWREEDDTDGSWSRKQQERPGSKAQGEEATWRARATKELGRPPPGYKGKDHSTNANAFGKALEGKVDGTGPRRSEGNSSTDSDASLIAFLAKKKKEDAERAKWLREQEELARSAWES
ncbi:hypothetical protein IE53DRAFT_82115 [Violaceomyces palustris]|uniref:Uncharacterized protein n=1 Tax=Violaceomyces palustris TaxID=1673888 RepID=A0ACD0NY21_9BASI|nr:hypothetical protein IE53DRAFT_82115 [Violaceomyces palustris]